MVASEVAPWSKTGGLADVAAALPAALAALGHHVTIVTPQYRRVAMPDGVARAASVRIGTMRVDVGLHVADVSSSQRVVFVDCPRYFDRDGYYGTPAGDFEDNAMRFALLATAALDMANDDGASVDVVHAHDWQAGLVPALLSEHRDRWPALAAAARVFTIHNLAYQGRFPKETVSAVGLPARAFGLDTGEFWGEFSFLKAGINYSDYITTVSPRYAEETLRPEFGGGLEGVLATRGDRYSGILNGIDTAVWDPATDPHLPAHYGADDLSGKRVCKRALLERLGLPLGDDALERPVIGVVSRLVEQKGIDLVVSARERLLRLDATWVFVGTGEARFERALTAMAAEHPARVATAIGFDEPLAHLVEAGADVFLMPSKFEPCGLNQMYSLRYGTVPVVHAVGGLDDTVRPWTSRARRANGFKFRPATADALVRTMRQALRVYRNPPAWHQLIERGMSLDLSWTRSAKEYVKVYRRARYEATTSRTARRAM